MRSRQGAKTVLECVRVGEEVGAGGATGVGDALVLAATLLAAAMMVAQGDLLAGRDPMAVTAIQFAAAAAVTLPFALVTEGGPPAPARLAPVLAVLALTVVGSVVPFTLFAYGQKHVSAELAGSFLNLEPLVGAVAGVVFFANPAGPRQLAGGAAIIAGIALSGLPLLPGRRRPPPSAAVRLRVAIAVRVPIASPVPVPVLVLVLVRQVDPADRSPAAEPSALVNTRSRSRVRRLGERGIDRPMP